MVLWKGWGIDNATWEKESQLDADVQSVWHQLPDVTMLTDKELEEILKHHHDALRASPRKKHVPDEFDISDEDEEEDNDAEESQDDEEPEDEAILVSRSDLPPFKIPDLSGR